MTAVAGVIFLGTPHNGSAFAKAGILQANFRSWFGHAVNGDILRPLVPGKASNELQELDAEWHDLVDDEERLSGLMMRYFYEKKPMKLGVCYHLSYLTCHVLISINSPLRLQYVCQLV
jgi:hypothetical protein